MSLYKQPSGLFQLLEKHENFTAALCCAISKR